MKRIKIIIVFLFLFCGFFLMPKHAFAVTCTSITSGTGNWNATGSWTGCSTGNGTTAGTPGSADTAIISTTGTITLTGNETVSALTFGTTAVAVTAGILKVN